MNLNEFPILKLQENTIESKICQNFVKNASFIDDSKINTLFMKTPIKFNAILERKKQGFVSEILFHGFN